MPDLNDETVRMLVSHLRNFMTCHGPADTLRLILDKFNELKRDFPPWIEKVNKTLICSECAGRVIPIYDSELNGIQCVDCGTAFTIEYNGAGAKERPCQEQKGEETADCPHLESLPEGTRCKLDPERSCHGCTDDPNAENVKCRFCGRDADATWDAQPCATGGHICDECLESKKYTVNCPGCGVEIPPRDDMCCNCSDDYPDFLF